MKNIFKLISEYLLVIVLILILAALPINSNSGINESIRNYFALFLGIITTIVFITRLIIEIKNDKG